jgi:hypothetical protein
MIARFRGPDRAEIRFVLADLAPPSCGFSAAEAIVIKPFLEQDFSGPMLPRFRLLPGKPEGARPGLLNQPLTGVD